MIPSALRVNQWGISSPERLTYNNEGIACGNGSSWKSQPAVDTKRQLKQLNRNACDRVLVKFDLLTKSTPPLSALWASSIKILFE
jgi:hypothetical protein